ncbi:MAG: hypothetical protein HIU89_18055 [Proteobacteria bacterium]|nr:hypothetical protein [Pseudomonadota bacterium]
MQRNQSVSSSVSTATQAKNNMVQAIKQVAEQLGNTPAVCRKCYVHPGVIASYLDGAMAKAFEKPIAREVANASHALRLEELDLLHLLKQAAEKFPNAA